MKALELLKLAQINLEDGHRNASILKIDEAIVEIEKLNAKTHSEEFKLIEQLKNINNDEANDFLKHFKRGAEAIIKTSINKN